VKGITGLKRCAQHVEEDAVLLEQARLLFRFGISKNLFAAIDKLEEREQMVAKGIVPSIYVVTSGNDALLESGQHELGAVVAAKKVDPFLLEGGEGDFCGRLVHVVRLG
jgi:hypothetical protein